MRKKILKFAVTMTAVALVFACATAVFAVLFVTQSDDYVPFDQTKLQLQRTNVKILDLYGNEIDDACEVASFKSADISTLNEYTANAFVSIEDKRFYKHNGLDVRRIVGAIVSNIKSMSFKEGASTITQQLIKNTHLTSGKTLKRKINEMLLAHKLEKTLDKKQILETYLNTIYFGRNAYGIEKASAVYFDKSAKDLTLAESATLAGMIKAPSTYSPDVHMGKCIERRNLVLKTMLENGFIEEKAYEEAKNEKLTLANKTVGSMGYVQNTLAQAAELLRISEKQLLTSNYVIRTYYEPNKQNALKEATAKSGKTANANMTAAFVDNKTLGVAACIGNARQRRQVGSTVKPFAVYAPAFDKLKLTENSLILDEKTNFSGYMPKNFDDKYHGWTTVKAALTQSYNVPAVKILNSVGLDSACEYMKEMGIKTATNEQNLSMALGNINGGINCAELTQAYATLANDGNCGQISFIKEISLDKNVVYKHVPKYKKVFSAQAAQAVTDCLRSAVESGTAHNLSSCNVVVAAKTGTVGTSQGNTDALVCGYTKNGTFTVWLYSDEMLPNDFTGGTLPTQMASDFLNAVYSKKAKLTR